MQKYDELFLTTTDTVTGLGAPVSKTNLEAINSLKQSPKNKKLVVMVSSLETAQKLKNWDAKANEIAKKVWPGAVTLVISKNLAVRVPKNKGLQELLAQKGPCYMTSANFSGQKTLSLNEAIETFQEIKEYHNFGKQSNKHSRIIDVTSEKVVR